MSHSLFSAASVGAALAAAALMPQQTPALLDFEIEIVEDSICEFVVTDSMLADIPFLDPADPERINSAWQDRMFALCEERDDKLSRNFTAWCLREEVRATRLAESPRLPWQIPLRYPLLEVTRNGHVVICNDI